jgi:ferritin-like protein
MLPHNHDGLIIRSKYFLIVFNISNIDEEINKELPEDDLIEDRNMLECFLKCLSDFNIA